MPSGFILCVPQRCVSEEELDQATLDDHSGDIGPWTNVNVLAVSVTGRELKKTLPCLLVDLRAQEVASLSAEAPVDSGLEFLSFGNRLARYRPAVHEQ